LICPTGRSLIAPLAVCLDRMWIASMAAGRSKWRWSIDMCKATRRNGTARSIAKKLGRSTTRCGRMSGTFRSGLVVGKVKPMPMLPRVCMTSLRSIMSSTLGLLSSRMARCRYLVLLSCEKHGAVWSIGQAKLRGRKNGYERWDRRCEWHRCMRLLARNTHF
jgi:hypothetical protein